jgi:hypothetical protein
MGLRINKGVGWVGGGEVSKLECYELVLRVLLSCLLSVLSQLE